MSEIYYPNHDPSDGMPAIKYLKTKKMKKKKKKKHGTH